MGLIVRDWYTDGDLYYGRSIDGEKDRSDQAGRLRRQIPYRCFGGRSTFFLASSGAVAGSRVTLLGRSDLSSC